jgi:uncharacterized protein
LTEEEWTALGGKQWLQRNDIQFHWHNAGYESFEDFLASLSSQKRKNIRKERASIAANGITMHALTGKAIGPSATGMPSMNSTWTPAAGSGARPI